MPFWISTTWLNSVNALLALSRRNVETMLCHSVHDISEHSPTQLLYNYYVFHILVPLNRHSTIAACSGQKLFPYKYTLLKSDVTSRDHVVRCRGSQECGSRFVNFACQFHWRWHSFRITLKSTTLLFMRSSNA